MSKDEPQIFCRVDHSEELKKAKLSVISDIKGMAKKELDYQLTAKNRIMISTFIAGGDSYP